MRWDDARILLALRCSRNASEAARALGISHTTVTRRLRALQESLEVRLLDRTPEGPRLTPEGAELARLAEPMESAADTMLRALAGAEHRLSGRVRVTATEALGARVLAPGLAALAGRHPGLTVELAPDPRALSLARREADIAVRLVRPVEKSRWGAAWRGWRTRPMRRRPTCARRGRRSGSSSTASRLPARRRSGS